MIDRTMEFREYLGSRASSDPAHDISHIDRVVKNARKYAAIEQANPEVVIPAAWLHDCVTVPKNSPDRAYASRMAATEAGRFLSSIHYDEDIIEQIIHAIESHSYSANVQPRTLEAKIVQDADRIDALGAIGISRCLLVGGSLDRSLYSRIDPFCKNREPEDEKYCVDHLFRKLFNIAETLHTEAARIDAEKRVKFMKAYLAELSAEISS